jgi:multisubunit Na+/H+ antiporter MnhB subunit
MNELIDWTLVLGLWSVALVSLMSRSIFRAVVFFILLGILLSLAWIRLDAPDIALAEAAIGAGITGVLLLDALGHLKKTGNLESKPTRFQHPRFWLAVSAAVSLVGVLCWAVWQQPPMQVALHQQVAQAMPDSGVDHPITAILLNFRSYDTLLEIGVLVLAILVGLTLKSRHSEPDSLPGLPNPLLHASLALLIPAILMASAYLLWAGADRPGGAFQAGAILAAAFILLHLAGIRLSAHLSHQLMRLGLVLGFSVFLAVATSSMIGGRPFLTYPDSAAGLLILVIELTLTLSIGLILLSLFTVANVPVSSVDRENSHEQ